MANFTGQLKSNEIFAALYNMIISQHVFADNIADTKSTLADLSRVDGTLFGDTKIWYATDVLKSFPWTNDAEAQNLLKLHRPEAPEQQAISIDVFRIVPLTIDSYLSKRAWSTEGAFSQFNSQMLGWMGETLKIFRATTFNSFIGTNTTDIGTQTREISLSDPPEGVDDYNLESYNRLVAQNIARTVADLIVDLEDVSRDLNDYGNLRSYNANDFRFVWNSEWVNMITKLDVPTIFHKDGLIDKFAQHTLPARYFGNVKTEGGTTSGANTTIRSLIEKDYNTVEPNQVGYDAKKHIFPGDLIPNNTAYEANEAYEEDNKIILKVYHKDSVPFMTAFETGTEFFNPRSLTQTHFLVTGMNELEHLKNYPFITVKANRTVV